MSDGKKIIKMQYRFVLGKYFIIFLQTTLLFTLSQLQELAAQLCDLWNLMETPDEERSLFDHITCNISATVDEVTVPGALALDLIEQVMTFNSIDISLKHCN